MKTIYLKVEVPDTIPDPELMVSARVKNTFDEWEDVKFAEIHLPTDGEMATNAEPYVRKYADGSMSTEDDDLSYVAGIMEGQMLLIEKIKEQ